MAHDPVRPWAGNVLTRALLCAALLNGGAAAQQASAVLPAECSAPEELLSVAVGGTERGTFVVRVSRGPQDQLSVLLPAAALRPAEQSYISQRIDCDGEAFVQLKPELQVRYDQSAQAVRVSPALNLLGSGSVDLSLPDPAQDTINQPQAQRSSWGINGGAQGNAIYRQTDGGGSALPNSYAGAGYVGVGAAQGRLAGYAGLLARTAAATPQAAAEFRAVAQLTVNPNLVIYGAWNANPNGNDPGFASSDFRGVAVSARGGFTRQLEELVIELPVEAEIEVTVNLKRIRAFRAAAGSFTLRHIPLSGSGPSRVVVYITDESGTRQVITDVPGSLRALPPGAYLASAQAGISGGTFSGYGAVQLGLTNGWAVSGQASAQRTPSADTSFSVRLSFAGAFEATRTLNSAGQVSQGWTANLNAGTSLGTGQVQGFAILPLHALQSSVVGARASYSNRNWLVGASGSSGFQAQTWQAGASATYFLGQRGSVSAQADLLPGRYRIGLSASFVPTPTLQVAAQVSSAPTGSQISGSVGYQLGPAQALRLNVSSDDAALSYAFSREVNVQATVGLHGASAQATGALVLTNGTVQVKPVLAQKALLIQTGIPNVRLLVGGTVVAVTDARGEALITDLPLGEVVSVRVDLASLPFGVALAAEQREVVPPLSGVTVVDWRDNFRAFRFVRFFWSEQEVASGTDVLIGGERVLVDDEGYGLTPSSSEMVKGEMRSNTDARSCRVDILPGQDRAVCTPG
jgi:outer membrane usher protein